MDKRVAHCHLVAGLLASDGMMTDSERAFLERAMEKMGLNDEERDAVKHFEGAELATDVMAKVSADERQALLDDLLGAALADGKLDPHEQEMVKLISDQLYGDD